MRKALHGLPRSCPVPGATWTAADEAALQRAQVRLRESAVKFGPAGRPASSSCACQTWPCPCTCHKDRPKKKKKEA